MAGLGDTVAQLLARVREAGGAAAAADLREVPSFGANPGGLRMWLHIPGRLPEGSPLVVVLHGCGQTAAGYATGAGWIELADRYGFALLCPEQIRSNNANLCFNWFEDADNRRGAGEAASIAQMVRHALADLDLDARRVFITGLSAGGAMAAVMLATYPELFSAGAVIAGLPYGAAAGLSQALAAMRRMPELSGRSWGDKVRAAAPTPERWPSIAIWHGDADATVTVAAARALALQWCDVHASTKARAGPSATSGHIHTTWVRPDGSVAVALHRVAGLGHGTPIKGNGDDACGSPAPWIVEAGISSSHEIARSWGILGERRPQAERSEDRLATRLRRKPSAPSGVRETIEQALRQAGLMG